tara:strand:- start:396 stop:668 length:273 start_codon:yes stop_codon:yes gene_type:complete
MKRNISLIMVFLFGCATAKMVEYVSFQDAVAKTGGKCQYLEASSSFPYFHDASDKEIKVTYTKIQKTLLRNGWKLKMVSGSNNHIWEKCK